MNPIRIYRFLPLSALLALLVAAGCSNSNGEALPAEETAEARRVVRVETQVVEPTSFEDVIEVSGTVEAVGDATLSAQSSGTVVSLVPLGTFVRAGQAVAQLDPGTAQATVEQAEAQVAAAQAAFDLAADNLKRQEPLYRDSVISAIEYENVRAQYNQAQAQLNQARAGLTQARELLKDTRVVAPFAGTIEERLVEVGEQVMPGAQVARIVNTGRVKVTAGVPERYAADIRVGTPASVRFQAYADAPRQGRVTFVGSAVNAQSRTFPVEIELENQEGRLKPQMVTTVHVRRNELDAALVVPQTAVLRDEDGVTVFVVDDSGAQPVAERRSITLGPSYQGRVVVVAGLAAGDEIITVGHTNVTQGDAVEVSNTALPPAGTLTDSTSR